MAIIEQLRKLDNVREFTIGGKKGYLHDDHRWVLPIIHHAQQTGSLPKPCTLAVFDAHHDSLEPQCLEEIRRMRVAGFAEDALVALCGEHLGKLDDDWIQAGMHLGLIGDAIVFGVRQSCFAEFPKRLGDDSGDEHLIELARLPGRELQYQGALSDVAKAPAHQGKWSILGWELEPSGGGFRFLEGGPPILLDFDLDCFIVQWNDYLFPWPDEVFLSEFSRRSTYWSTEGLTGKQFVEGLLHKAGLITVAREPKHCGGPEKAEAVLIKLNRFLFDGRMELL